MKGQGTSLSRRLSEEMNISGEVVSVMPDYSQNLEGSQNDVHPNYVQLRDMSKKRKSRLTAALDILTALGIREEALAIGQPLQVLLSKETSCVRYFRWAVVDNLAEKTLQGLILNKQDISKENVKFCTGMIRQVPSGRSLLLHQAYSLKKVYAARGLVLTTEMVLNEAFQIFIAVSLSVRVYEFLTTGTSSFSELETIFAANSSKGVSSMVHFLANFDSGWLYSLLASPAIAGALKGLWDTQKSQRLTENDLTQLQEAVNYHTNSLIKKFYLWSDILRQIIPIPVFSSVSERVQKAEQQLRWDGRITNEQRTLLFLNIERLALCGGGISQINAMQSLAKIVHSFSLKDFNKLQQAGYPRETLVQILRIKTQALHDLKVFPNRAHLQPVEKAGQRAEPALQQSFLSKLYATYLLWWLGMGEFKYSLLFWSFKLGKLTLQGLFVKTLVQSILEVINCPDKQGFRMFFGDYEIWANQLTPDCFNEFVSQFRLIDKEEPFEPFLEQLSNFDLRTIESLNLAGKAFTSNETRQILNVLINKAAPIQVLNLGANKITDTVELLFPNGLKSLELGQNSMGDEGAKALRLPLSLTSVGLTSNNITSEGAKGLRFPDALTSLDLMDNIGPEGAKGLKLPLSLQYLQLGGNIGAEGVKGLQLPPMLTNLALGGNNIGVEGAKSLQFPSGLQFLNLMANSLGAEGAKGLKFPASLKSLYLGLNNISDEGAIGLQLPSKLQYLSLMQNNIGAEGADGLKLPLSLQTLDLSFNSLGANGAKRLKLPASLQVLDLRENKVGDEGAIELQLPKMLQSLDLMANNIGDEGAKGLRLPLLLQSLSLWQNNIGDEGAIGLLLPSTLTSLVLSQNNIGSEGAKGLQLPSMLQHLDLGVNNINAEGTKGLRFPAKLQFLNLQNNNLGAEGVKELRLPSTLAYLSLYYNNIGAEGVKELKLSSSLRVLSLRANNISNEGAQGLQLPLSLQSLDLMENNIGDEGAKGLQLPAMLQSLSLWQNNIGDEGAKRLQLPVMLQSLLLGNNKIGDEGVKALLKKIPKTNLMSIDLGGNPYNSTALTPDRVVQQQILLKNCRDKLCHVNTPLGAQPDEYQTSGATSTQPSLFFSWLKKPFDKLSEYVSDYIGITFDNISIRLEKILSQSPSYFPNIHSPKIHDWQPSGSGSVMLHQFNTRGSNTLLLSGAQTAIQPSLSAIVQ